MEAKSRAGKIINLTPKKQSKTGNSVDAFITQLNSILEEDWGDDQVSTFLVSCQSIEETEPDNDEQDPLYILAATIHKANAENPSDFSAIFHLNVKELETYERAMNGPHAQ